MMSSVNHYDVAHLKIPLQTILTATNNFDDINNIEKADFGNQYQGQLLWSGELIKICARRYNKEWSQRDQEFWMEISMLSTLKHRNLVSLVGFCDENDEKVIIIKFETLLSLDNYLSDTMMLTWVRRLGICVGLANALSYTHYDEEHDFSVIHGNIDSLNVHLNDDYEAKLSEFRLCMKIAASERHHSFHVDKVWDREGYTDPAYIETKSVSQKSDIYSFGVVMFELLCGRKSVIYDDQDNKYLVPMVILHYREEKLEDIVEWNLWKQIDPQSFKVFTEIAYNCLNEERSQRPKINEIITKLEKALELARVNEHIMSSPSNQFAHLKVPLQSILSATKNFAAQNNIWYTTFAKEYKGQLLWSGELIDISAKRFNKESYDREQLFWTEISTLSSLKHKNLVSLVGFCDENDEKIVITRYETKGMLSGYLSDPMLLTWVRRLEICVAVAHALSYLHYDEPRDFSVIHRFISIGRVVLNDEWEPKLYDFIFSMKIKASQRHHSFHTNRLVYVDGYEDPAYIETKRVNHKSEMYSFGIVMFELLCGTTSISYNPDNKYLGPVAIFHYKKKILDEIIDPVLWKQMDPQSFNVFAEIAYDCLNEERSQRPNINEIVTRLESALEHQRERQNYDKSRGEGSSSFIHKKFQHLKIELQAIKAATKEFDDSHCIGKGGFGKVYKGELVQGQSVVALKRLNRAYGQGDPEFWKEIIMLSLYKHANIVSLLGFCDDCGEKILVYDYASRKSLDLYLDDKDLTWVQRLKICIGAARGIAYLHNPGKTQQRVLHRDIKSSNILLDENWNARIADFGLSKFGPANQQNTFLVSNGVGTIGYCDPLYVETGLLTKESDVYSFGVVLFEILCGRLCIRNNHDKHQPLTTLVRKCYEQKTIADIVYGNIRDEISSHSLKEFTAIAYQCLNRDHEQRPLMTKVVEVLQSALICQVFNEPSLASLSLE